jgi:quercetin dioxygenase-like cupin family protein
MTTFSKAPVLQLEILRQSEGPAFDLLGARYATKAEGNAMNNAFYIVEILFPAGARVPLHLHPEPEFFYVLSGVCEFATSENGSEKWIVGQTGDSILVPIDVPHGLRNESDADARLLVVTTHGHGLFFQEAGAPADSAKPLRAATDGELERVMKTAACYGTYTLTPETSFAKKTLAARPPLKLIPRCYWRLEHIVDEDGTAFKLER